MNWVKFRNKNEKGDFTHICFHCYVVGEKYAMRVFTGWGDGERPDLLVRQGGIIYRKTKKSISSNIKEWCDYYGIEYKEEIHGTW